jgi:hypothetical protein
MHRPRRSAQDGAPDGFEPRYRPTYLRRAAQTVVVERFRKIRGRHASGLGQSRNAISRRERRVADHAPPRRLLDGTNRRRVQRLAVIVLEGKPSSAADLFSQRSP